MPREVFEDFVAPLTEADVEGMQRGPDGSLVPTSKTTALYKYKYTLKRGSVTDKLFRLQELDPELPPPKKSLPEVEHIGTGNVYEVEQIEQSRKKGKRTEYLIKWLNYPESDNTWEPASRIHFALVAAFEGKQARAAAARFGARLAQAWRRRGARAALVRGAAAGRHPSNDFDGVRQRDRRAQGVGDAGADMPTLTLTFFVLSMDKSGHIIWPTNFSARSQAALRMQARALLQKMMDDPLNPVDSTMAPALTGLGTSAVWQGASRIERR